MDLSLDIRGNELKGPHHCVVLQDDSLNKALRTVVVAPLVKSLPKVRNLDFAIEIKSSFNNRLDRCSRWVDLSQIKSVSFERMQSKYGVLDDDDFWQLEGAFYALFGSEMFPPPPID